MTRREKIGLVVIIGLFAVLILVVAWGFSPGSQTTHAPEDSIFIRQRVINLQKGQR
jgi:hypothetical protein